MPRYEYHCEKCQREVTLTLSIPEHEKGKVKCPKCGPV
jgi:putative FmdB family regulatory protein